MADLYIIKDGKRIYRETASAIITLAKRVAQTTGMPVTVYSDGPIRSGHGRKIHAVKNPAKAVGTITTTQAAYARGKKSGNVNPFTSPSPEWKAWNLGKAKRPKTEFKTMRGISRVNY